MAETRPTIDEIKRAVCDVFEIRMADLMSPHRCRTLAYPRHVAMFLAVTMTRQSRPTIGRLFQRDQSTATYARDKIAAQIENDWEVSQDIEKVRVALKALIAQRPPMPAPDNGADDARSVPSPRPTFRPGYIPRRGPRGFRASIAYPAGSAALRRWNRHDGI